MQYIDEIGNKYGKLTVIKYNGKKMWMCQCECGNTKIVRGSILRSGNVKSCGCIGAGPKVQLICNGTKFGNLTILKYMYTKNSDSIYECKCDCGNIIQISRRKLLSNKYVHHCGCKTNLVGKKFNHLTVISRAESKSGKRMWLVECDCGSNNKIIVSSNTLISGHTKSCGCTKLINPYDIIGQRRSSLIIISFEYIENGRYYYLCECTRCNGLNIIERSNIYDENVHTKTCGCLRRDQLKTHGMSKTIEYRKFYDNAKKRKRRIKEQNLSQKEKWTLEMELYLLKIFKNRCSICGDTKKICIDHLRPLSRGFSLEPGNATLLCSSCNSWKWNKSIDNLPEWIGNKLERHANQFLYAWTSYQLPSGTLDLLSS